MWVEKVLDRVPLLSSALRASRLAHFCIFLEGLVVAGFMPDKSWPLAAQASGSPMIEEAVRSLVPLIRQGKSPAEILPRNGPFPPEFIDQMRTGELAGEIDSTLKLLAEQFSERADARLQTVIAWTGRMFQLGVLLAIAYGTISSLSHFSTDLPRIE